MENKKTIVLGIIAIVVLAGVVWYGSQNQEIIKQAASIIENITEEEPAAETEILEEFVLGNPEAPVTIIDYSSHFCGHCVAFHNQTLPFLIDEYVNDGRVKIIFRLLSPLELGMSLLCAQEQGKFQKFNDILFERAQELQSVDDIKAIAVELNLNQDDFNQCFDSEKYELRIKEWFNQAEEAGISGTPTFFINDQMITGNMPYIIFKEAIEQELAE